MTSNFVPASYVAGDNIIVTQALVEKSAVTIIAANPSRKAIMLYNNSSKPCYISYGATVSTTIFSFVLAANATYTHVLPYIYIGPLTGIRDSGTGAILTTEFS